MGRKEYWEGLENLHQLLKKEVEFGNRMVRRELLVATASLSVAAVSLTSSYVEMHPKALEQIKDCMGYLF
ncbi:MAG: hypothetical protein ABIH37_02020 [archaeon]